MPETDGSSRCCREQGLPAVVSGAGPASSCSPSDPSQRLEAAELVDAHGGTPWEALMLAVDFKGATVNTHGQKQPLLNLLHQQPVAPRSISRHSPSRSKLVRVQTRLLERGSSSRVTRKELQQ